MMDENKILKDLEDFTKRNYQEFHFVIVKDAIEAFKKKLQIEEITERQMKDFDMNQKTD